VCRSSSRGGSLKVSDIWSAAVVLSIRHIISRHAAATCAHSKCLCSCDFARIYRSTRPPDHQILGTNALGSLHVHLAPATASCSHNHRYGNAPNPHGADVHLASPPALPVVVQSPSSACWLEGCFSRGTTHWGRQDRWMVEGVVQMVDTLDLSAGQRSIYLSSLQRPP
jgi:hypothetical protein